MAVLIEAVHVVKPLTNTAFDSWVEWYGNDVIPAVERNGFDVLGAFKRSTGPMGEDVLLIRFASMGEYERASASLRADKEFLRSAAAIADRWQVTESSKVAAFVPYATEARLERALAERPAKPRQYLQAVLRINFGGQIKAYETIGKLADMVDASGSGQLVTAYETTVGQRGELTDLWALPSVPDLSYRPGDPLADLISDLRSVAPEEATSYLNPLPYSKLQ